MRAIRLVAAPLVLLLVSGCAPKMNFSNEAGGVISQKGSMGNDRAYTLATDHCGKFGKIARITARDVWTNTTRFECVVR